MRMFPKVRSRCRSIPVVVFLFVFLMVSGQLSDLRFSVQYNWFKQDNFQSYLQYPDSHLSLISNIIIGDSKTDDEKAEKILKWVVANFKYESDYSVYGEFEHWAKPTDALKLMRGDCEDGAFIIHSLLLHANVNPENIRTEGGVIRINKLKNGKVVFDTLTGHSWTTYRRSDGKWVALDWCNETESRNINEIKAIKDDPTYVKSFIAFNIFGDVLSTYINNPIDES
jgi:hypothetical protein